MTGKQQHRRFDSIKHTLFVSLLLTCFIFLLNPAIAQGGAFNDAYSYIDLLKDDTGLDADNSEIGNIEILPDGGLKTTQANIQIASRCFQLPQPEGGVFQQWLFAEINLETPEETSDFIIQDCSGQPLITKTLSNGQNRIDLSAIPPSETELQLVWKTDQIGMTLKSWKVYGQAEGVTHLDIIPAASEPKAGETITFIIRLSSNGAVTLNPVLTFSLDVINGYGGLAEDGTLDYGDGAKPYHLLEFVSASNGPNGEKPVQTPEVGKTEGEVKWNLHNLSDGFSDTVTVVLRIPKGYVNAKTLRAKAVLTHGAEQTMRAEAISTSVKITSTHNAYQTTNSNVGNVGPNPEGIPMWDAYGITSGSYHHEHASDIEDVLVTITPTGDGTCMPRFEDYRVYGNHGYQVLAFSPELLKIRLYRTSYASDRSVRVFYSAPAGCHEGDTLGTRSEAVGGNPGWNETDGVNHKIVLETCRGAYNCHTHRVMNGNDPGSYTAWPESPEYYISKGSLRAGEYFTTWTPNGSNGKHTIFLDHSYVLMEIPEGISFHGVRGTGQLDRLYKDCSGTAPDPTKPEFNHNADFPHPEWKPVDIAWNGIPFSNLPDKNDPQAVVLPGCRLLLVKDDDSPVWQGPDYGGWRPLFLWRVCDGSYGCSELSEGTGMSLIRGGMLFTYETITKPEGVVHECNIFEERWTLYKEQKSWPKVYAWPEENQVPTGQMAEIIVNPENSNQASQFVKGRWVLNFYKVKDYVNLNDVQSKIFSQGVNVPPGCDIEAVNNDSALFKGPNSSCSAPDDENCMAYWKIPDVCQPPNGWGYRISGDYTHDNYVQMYQFLLKVPILRTTPPNTILDFVAEVRTTDLAQPGADNAVDSARWAATNYTATASVKVLEQPGLDIAGIGPFAQSPGNTITYHLELENWGNTPNNGWYIVDWLPRAGVNRSTFTPEHYGQVFVNQPAAEVIMEYSTESSCFSNPLGVVWKNMTLYPYGDSLDVYKAFSVDFLTLLPTEQPACLRLHRHQNATESFDPGERLLLKLEVPVPCKLVELDKDALYNRALAGAAAAFGSASNIPPVETVDVRTLISNRVAMEVAWSYEIDPTRPGWIRWELQIANVSGAAAANISGIYTVPEELSYEGLAAQLPAGWSVEVYNAMARFSGQYVAFNQEGLPSPLVTRNSDFQVDGGGQIRFTIDWLAADDGNLGSGEDEGRIAFWTRVNPDIPTGTVVTICAAATPEKGEGDEECTSLTMSALDVTKTQELEVDWGGGAIPRVKAGETIFYTIDIINQFEQAVFLQIYDLLDVYVDYVAGSLRINDAVASDNLFSGDLLDYHYPDMINPGETLTISYEVLVLGAAPLHWIIENTAVISACTNPFDPESCFPAVESDTVRAEVIPEPSVLILLSTGLCGIIMLIRRKQRKIR